MPVSLCLALWLTGCAAPPVKVVTLPPVPLPEGLLAACPAPLPPEPLTFGASVDYSLQLLAVIKQCNADKAALRQAEHYRQEQPHDE
ncbi:Rz1-like lysis system protein LysC [Arsenophonus sp. PmNCSU2021_1]|uniref:Rz1-like lysis system protein LysC n=1 Tax=Arsenophonus sp. PmNCSU2021_1 TaxID=3118989 RepID=UPI003FA52DDC